MAEARSLLDSIKEDLDKSGGGDSNILRISESPTRIRFLKEIDDGVSVIFHSKWDDHNHPCLKQYGKSCPNCDNPESKTVRMYYWPIWNYEKKEMQWFGAKATPNSSIPYLVNITEEHGSVTNQDIIVKKTGERFETKYPCKVTGRKIPWKAMVKKYNIKEKPGNKKQLMDMLYDTFKEYGKDLDYDYDEDFEEDEEEYIEPKKKPKPSRRKKPEPEYYEDDDEDDDSDLPWDEYEDDDEEEEDYNPPKKRRRKK